MTKPKKTHAKRYTAADYAKAVTEAQGLISVAARRLGVTRSSVYSAINKHASVREAVEDARERTTDLAEGKLFSKISEGDMTAIIFYLKTQAKGRGYVERQEHNHSGSIDLRKLNAMTDEELEKLASELGIPD